MPTAQRIWNGAATKWIVGSAIFVTGTTVVAFSAFVIGHTQSPGHPVIIDRHNRVQADLSAIRTDLQKVEVTLQENTLMLREIQARLERDE